MKMGILPDIGDALFFTNREKKVTAKGAIWQDQITHLQNVKKK